MDGSLSWLDPKCSFWHHSFLPASHPCSHTQAFLQPSGVAVATATTLGRCAEQLGPWPWVGQRQPEHDGMVWVWPSQRNGSSFCKPRSEPVSTVLLSEGCPSDHPHETAQGTRAVQHGCSPVCPSHRHCHLWGCRRGHSRKWSCPSPWGQCHPSHSG